MAAAAESGRGEDKRAKKPRSKDWKVNKIEKIEENQLQI